MQRTFFACPLLALVLCTAMRAQSDSQAMEDAEALYRSGKYAEAASAYEQITKTEPGNETAWRQWGNSLWEIGETRGAIEALQKADGLLSGMSTMQAGVRFCIGRAWARLGERDRAFDWLDQALQSGFPNFQQFSADRDLSKLSDDPRYWKIYAQLYARTPPAVSGRHEPGGRAFHGGKGGSDYSLRQEAIARRRCPKAPGRAAVCIAQAGARHDADPLRMRDTGGHPPHDRSGPGRLPGV